MTFELRINGETRLLLKPESQIESLALQEMAEGASKGQRVMLQPNGPDLELRLEQ